MLDAGSQAPQFRLRGTGGELHTLAEIIAEGPVLLAFYKASCPVCQLTLPYLERVTGGVLRVFYISQDNARTTDEFRRAFRLNGPVLLDEAGNGYPASNAFGISTVPSLFQVETDGTVSHAWAGWSKADMIALGERAGREVIGPTDNVPVLRPG